MMIFNFAADSEGFRLGRGPSSPIWLQISANGPMRPKPFSGHERDLRAGPSIKQKTFGCRILARIGKMRHRYITTLFAG